MSFQEDSSTLGAAEIEDGSARVVLSSLSVGRHEIVAVYGGDDSHAPSTSDVEALTIANAASSVAPIAETPPPPAEESTGGGRGQTGGSNVTGIGAGGKETVRGESSVLIPSAATNPVEALKGLQTEVPNLALPAAVRRLTASDVATILSRVSPDASGIITPARRTVTRAEAAQMILQSFDLSPSTTKSNSMREAVVTARKLGILEGLQPTRPVTSAEFALMVKRAQAIRRPR